MRSVCITLVKCDRKFSERCQLSRLSRIFGGEHFSAGLIGTGRTLARQTTGQAPGYPGPRGQGPEGCQSALVQLGGELLAFVIAACAPHRRRGSVSVSVCVCSWESADRHIHTALRSPSAILNHHHPTFDSSSSSTTLSTASTQAAERARLLAVETLFPFSPACCTLNIPIPTTTWPTQMLPSRAAASSWSCLVKQPLARYLRYFLRSRPSFFPH